MNPSYDFAVIGGGSAGYAAARTAAALGLRIVVIDGAEELCGLCILRGCMPSKTLIESANRALSVRRAAEFGLAAQLTGVDVEAIRDRKRALVADFAGHRQSQLANGRFDLVRGTAQFIDAATLRILPREGEEQEVAFKTCLIATGSVVSAPDLPGLQETGFWTSDTVLDAAAAPASFVILGGGAIALELAHFLEGIGRHVTILQRSPHLLSAMDHEVGDAMRVSFERRGLAVHCGVELTGVSRQGSRKRVQFNDAAGPQSVEAEEILLALGRRAAVDHLGLGQAGVEVERGRVLALSTQQTSQPHIFAAGDVCGPLEVVHLAIQQGELAARNAAQWLQGREVAGKMDYRLKLFGVFTHPQAAQVGLTEAEARRDQLPVRVATHPFNDHGKSMVMGETEGFVKMIADAATGELLGASVVGAEAVELIHAVTVAMHFRCTAAEFLKIPFYHPTLSEIWTYPAEEIVEAMAR